MPTIAVVNDDRNALTSISTVLKAEGFRVATYTNGASALDDFRTAPPDLAILDSNLPRMDGMEMLRRLRAKSDLPVIFLTSQEEAADEVFALQLGADDYIRKPVSQRLLVARVKAVLRRASPNGATLAKKATDNVLECGSLRMDPERHTCTWKHKRIKLTVTEFLVLHALASRPGVVKSRNELMDVAYGDPLNTDERNVDSHIKRMRRKFTASDSQFNIIESMYGVGYRCKEP